MIRIENFKNGMEGALWEVYFSAIRIAARHDYIEQQLKTEAAPDGSNAQPTWTYELERYDLPH